MHTCSVQCTVGFCCYSPTWSVMISSLWWIMSANYSKTLGRYCCLTDSTEPVWFLFDSPVFVLPYVPLNLRHRCIGFTTKKHKNREKNRSKHTLPEQEPCLLFPGCGPPPPSLRLPINYVFKVIDSGEF